MRISRVLCAALIAAAAFFNLSSRAYAGATAGVCVSLPSQLVTFTPGLPLAPTVGAQTLNTSSFSCTLTNGPGSLLLSGRLTGATGCASGALEGTLTASFSSPTVSNTNNVLTVMTNDAGTFNLVATSLNGQIAFTGVLVPNTLPCPTAWSGTLVVEDPTIDGVNG